MHTAGLSNCLCNPLLDYGFYFFYFTFNMKQSTSYSILMIGALVWCTGIILPAVLESFHIDASLIYIFYGKICHQIDGRSFHIAGHKLAVCSRCTGLYGGFMLGLVAYPFLYSLQSSRQTSRIWLFMAAVPMFVDVMLNTSGLYSSTFLTRLITGGVLGFTIAFVVTPLFLEALSTITLFQRRIHADKT